MFKELWESIKKNEGYEPKVYKDHLGFDTIGVGFKVSELHLDEDVCDIIGVRKLNDIQAQLIATFPWYPEMPQVKNDYDREFISNGSKRLVKI